MRMKCLRILPEIWARTLRWPGRSTRNIVPGNTSVTVPSVTICSSFGIRANIITDDASLNRRVAARCLCSARTCPLRAVASHSDVATTTLSTLLKSLERDCRQVFAEFLSFPPRARFSMLVAGGKSVSIESGPDVSRRFLRKRIAREEPRHVRFAFEQANFEVVEPQISLR